MTCDTGGGEHTLKFVDSWQCFEDTSTKDDWVAELMMKLLVGQPWLNLIFNHTTENWLIKETFCQKVSFPDNTNNKAWAPVKKFCGLSKLSQLFLMLFVVQTLLKPLCVIKTILWNHPDYGNSNNMSLQAYPVV